MAAKGKEGASSKDIEEGTGRGKKAQGREGQEKGSEDWTEKVAKLRRKGREK